MKLLEIYNLEHTRKDFNKIHFYKDGDASPWYRAYEWSAFLAEYYPVGADSRKKLTPTHRNLKEDENGIINVGLQHQSISKYFPNATIEQIDENHVVISVDLAQYGISGDMESVLANWKESVPIAQQKKVKNPIQVRTASFTEVLKAVVNFRLDTATDEDCRDFIAEIKEMCVSMI